jgi:hypothetical protein
LPFPTSYFTGIFNMNIQLASELADRILYVTRIMPQADHP